MEILVASETIEDLQEGPDLEILEGIEVDLEDLGPVVLEATMATMGDQALEVDQGLLQTLAQVDLLVEIV